MESEHESESNDDWKKDANNSRNKDDALSPIISAKKSDHDSKSEEEMSKLSYCSSCSESSSDYFQIDAKIPQKSSTFSAISPEAQEDSQSLEKREKDDTQGNVSSKTEDPGENSPCDPSSQSSHATNESTLQTASPVQSPPIQMMEKTGGYDPNRIPDSVFRTSSSTMDWSVASNESLFSLHLGNNSFSREQFLMMGEELHKSGELNRPNELVKSGRPPLSPVAKLQEEKATISDKKPEQAKAADETMVDSLKPDVFDQFEEKETEAELNGHSSMINRSSDASATSTQSFAFPILVDTTKTLRNDSSKGPSPRQQAMKQAVYDEIIEIEKQTKSSSSYWGCCCCFNCCSLPHWSCPSYQHCCSWKWCKKWFCCSCC